MYHHILLVVHPKGWMNAKPLLVTVVFSLRVNELILDLLGSLNNFLTFPFCIVHFGVLRQGPDKFYSLSFLAILSLFFRSWACRSPES
jgi:hypothetical protein